MDVEVIQIQGLAFAVREDVKPTMAACGFVDKAKPKAGRYVVHIYLKSAYCTSLDKRQLMRINATAHLCCMLAFNAFDRPSLSRHPGSCLHVA